jgi:hypothetical protein
VTLLDYGAGNVRSVRNAIKQCGFTIKDVSAALLACLPRGACQLASRLMQRWFNCRVCQAAGAASRRMGSWPAVNSRPVCYWLFALRRWRAQRTL